MSEDNPYLVPPWFANKIVPWLVIAAVSSIIGGNVMTIQLKGTVDSLAKAQSNLLHAQERLATKEYVNSQVRYLQFQITQNTDRIKRLKSKSAVWHPPLERNEQSLPTAFALINLPEQSLLLSPKRLALFQMPVSWRTPPPPPSSTPQYGLHGVRFVRQGI